MLIGRILHGDSVNSGQGITHDSLETLLERGRLVGGITGELDPEAFRLAQWWEREGAADPLFFLTPTSHLRRLVGIYWLG